MQWRVALQHVCVGRPPAGRRGPRSKFRSVSPDDGAHHLRTRRRLYLRPGRDIRHRACPGGATSGPRAVTRTILWRRRRPPKHADPFAPSQHRSSFSTGPSVRAFVVLRRTDKRFSGEDGVSLGSSLLRLNRPRRRLRPTEEAAGSIPADAFPLSRRRTVASTNTARAPAGGPTKPSARTACRGAAL